MSASGPIFRPMSQLSSLKKICFTIGFPDVRLSEFSVALTSLAELSSQISMIDVGNDEGRMGLSERFADVDSILPHLAPLKSLSELTIRVAASTLNFQALQRHSSLLQSLDHLTEFRLMHCSHVYELSADLAAGGLTACRQLKSLCIDNVALNPEAAELFLSMPYLTQLTVSRIDTPPAGCNTDVDLHAVPPHNYALKELTIR